MKLLTSQQMRELDRAAVERHGVPSLDLMERAGRGVAGVIRKRFEPQKGTVVVVAGRGNNGGDGLVCARHLISAGYEVTVLLLASPSLLTPDARASWELLAPLTTHLLRIESVADLNSHRTTLVGAGCIVDAILGTGLDRQVSGLALAAIEAINSSGVPVIAVDIPSGLSADTGLPLGLSVSAAVTVTFCLPKRGLFIGQGLNYTGQVEVVDIGIPQEEMEKVKAPLSLIDPSMFVHKLPKRRPNAHKGTFGHVVIFAGSRGHLGAGYLASLAALRAGCGVVTYCIPEKAFVRFDARYPEVMCDPLPDAGLASFHPSGLDEALAVARGKSAVAIGPAIGTSPDTREFVNGLVKRIDVPLIIDADGLNVLDLVSVKRRRSCTILTPHPGEMSRLMGATTSAVQADRIGMASKLAATSGAIVILKGQGTVVAEPDGSASINPTGNAGMATAGMGDALTGVVASFLAQGMNPRDAGVAAVYIHGLAGDMAAAELSERALITSDVIRCLGKAIKEIETRD